MLLRFHYIFLSLCPIFLLYCASPVSNTCLSILSSGDALSLSDLQIPRNFYEIPSLTLPKTVCFLPLLQARAYGANPFLRSLLSQLLRLPHSLRPGGGKAFAGVKKYGAHINYRQGLLEERKALFGAGFDNQEPFFEPQQWVRCIR